MSIHHSAGLRWYGAVALLTGLVLLGACSSGDDDAAPAVASTSSTRAAADCPRSFTIPLRAEVDDACRRTYLRSTAAQEGIELTSDAESQAVAFCREAGVSGLVEAMTLSFLGWEDGSRPEPADDHTGFVAMATGIYCPEFFDQLRALNG